MILVVSLLVLAIVGTPLFALLALTSITGFLERLSGDGWVAPALDALGRRGLNSPELAALPLVLLLDQLSRALPPVGAASPGRSTAVSLSLAALLLGVAQDIPLRGFALAVLAPAAAVTFGTLLIHRSLCRPSWQSLVCAGLLAGFLGGVLRLHEALALCVIVPASALASAAAQVRWTAFARSVVASAVQAGALCLLLASWLGVQALWEQTSFLAVWREQVATGNPYRLGACLVFGAELLRVAWPTLEHFGAAYLGERYGAPMDGATRAQAILVVLVLAACAAWPALTGWPPRMAA